MKSAVRTSGKDEKKRRFLYGVLILGIAFDISAAIYLYSLVRASKQSPATPEHFVVAPTERFDLNNNPSKADR